MTMTSELRDQAVHVAGALDPETMSGEQAAMAVHDLATAERATSAALLFAALRVARTEAWRGRGHASAADWLAAQAGISVREAAAHLGTAKKADRLGKTKDAMKKGDLSADQAGAVADGATADPSAEDDLLESAANDTNKALKDKAARAKAAATDSAARERRIRSRRSLRRGTDAEGAFWLRLYGPGVDAAAFEATLRPFEEHVFRHGRHDGVRDSFENRSYDAFVTMLAWLREQTGQADPGVGPPRAGGSSAAAREDDGCDAAEEAQESTERDEVRSSPDHDVQADAASRPDPQTGPDPSRHRAADSDVTDVGDETRTKRAVPLPRRLPGGANTKVIVNVDHDALRRGFTLAGETCEIAGVGPVSVEAVREILGTEPFLAVVVRKGRDVVNVAHHGRGLNAHQRTAIEAGGLRCTNRACNKTIAIQIDHRVPYATDPVTKLDNQDPLCPECHRRKTHHGWTLEPGNGPRRLLPPPDDQARPFDAPRSGDRSDEVTRSTGPTGPRVVRVEQPSLC